MAQAGDIPVIIPAFQPDKKLTALIKELQSLGFAHIVVVNDGSDEACSALFAKAQAMGCTVLTHSVNLGKGRALKTAFNHCLSAYPQSIGCVTADSDGQHTAACVLRCAQALCSEPQKLVMGCRDFSSPEVPKRHRRANRVTTMAFRGLYGIRCSDTQSGLRGVPADFMRYLLSVTGERFEFEINMLAETKQANVEIQQVPIELGARDDHDTTHLSPVRDSRYLYLILVKFLSSSLLSTLVDFVLFSLFIQLLDGWLPALYIGVSTVLARLCSAALSYRINSKSVFKSQANRRASILRFALVSVLIMLSSAALVTLLHGLLGGSELVEKLLVDAVLFCVNFVLQRAFVFKKSK